jgi:hypothetical protein
MARLQRSGAIVLGMNEGILPARSDDVRERVIAGQANRADAQAFIEGLEDELVRALNAAAEATNRVAQEKVAARNLIDAMTNVVKTEPLSERARLGLAAIERHQLESP